MARTAAGTALTAQHRRAQAAIASVTLRRLTALWDLLDPNDLDRTSAAWVAASTDAVRGGYALSARAAATYYAAFRAVEVGTTLLASTVLPPATRMNTDAVRTSFIVTGPVSIKSGTGQGRPLERTVADSLVRVLGAGQRHTLAGGRDTIQDGIATDQVVIGYARVLGGEGCAFCVMLASRGAVYTSGESASSSFQASGEDLTGYEVHDHCQCSVEPIMGDRYRLPTSTYDAMEKYRAATDPDGEWRRSDAGQAGQGQPAGSNVPQQIYELRRYLEASRA